MKTISLTILMILAAAAGHAQTYLISFSASGAGTTLDSVKVENLSKCTTLTIAGTDTLLLSSLVDIDETEKLYDHLCIFPNPASSHCFVKFISAASDEVRVTISDVGGKTVLQNVVSLTEGEHTFELDGLNNGIYCFQAASRRYLYTAKIISTTAAKQSHVSMTAVSSCNNVQRPHPDKEYRRNERGMKSMTGMQFNAGDTLKLTGISGNYKTVRMLFPDHNQHVVFTFVPCADADSNHYAVVQIGTQLWMQENLRTTTYRDGSAIPNVPDSATWAGSSSGAWCDYHNDPAEGAQYGHLYNFYAVADSRNMCPVGWHVPSHSEWNIMEKYLDNTVDTNALMGTGLSIGRILKEGCNTRWQYYDSTSGLNSAGFTALCTNYRVSGGAWSLAPNNNHDDCFWTSTSYNSSSAWFRSLRWCTCDIYVLFPLKKAGYSVRCVKD